MTRWIIGCLVGCFMLSATAAADFQRRDGQTFLKAAAVAEQLELKFELVVPGKLATFCSRQPPATCIPVRLTEANHLVADREVYILHSELVRALSITVDVTNNTLRIQRQADRPAGPPTAAYHSEWGPGRGFDVGQTVPDIPLIDMQGHEVRFSEFLGKRYILYCWASW